MPPLTRRQIEALRACGINRFGMRFSAHQRTMKALAGMGLVEAKAPYQARDLRWFLTAAGERALEAVGTGEPRE